MKEGFKKESYLIDYLKLSKKEPVFKVLDFKMYIDKKNSYKFENEFIWG